MTKRGLLLVMGLALVGAWVFARVTQPRQAAGAQLRAASLGVHTASLGDVTVGDLGGQVVLVDFWATWCPPCRASMPSIERLYRRYHRRGLAVVGISLDIDDSAIAAFARTVGVTYPVGPPVDAAAAEQYVRGGIPGLLLVDKHGTVRWRRDGYGPLAEGALASRIEVLLKE